MEVVEWERGKSRMRKGGNCDVLSSNGMGRLGMGGERTGGQEEW